MANNLSFVTNFSDYPKSLTQEGKDFIFEVCKGTGNRLLSGNNGRMPYTYPALNQVWNASIVMPTDNPLGIKMITTGEELANSLIYWFNYYAKLFGIDANVAAAQAYAESGYKMWTYVKFINNSSWQSTASGINQFLMSTLYDVIIDDNGSHYNKAHPFTADEIARITNGLTQPLESGSYQPGSKTEGPPSASNKIAWDNRPILHQNIINNPDIMIKAQCTYLKYIADLCDSYTSSTLFCYSRGPGFAKSTYLDTLNACKLSKANSKGTYIQEGLNYVLSIFGILGDKNNLLSSKGLGHYKPNGYYFGYEDKVRLFEPYDAFSTTLG